MPGLLGWLQQVWVPARTHLLAAEDTVSMMFLRLSCQAGCSEFIYEERPYSLTSRQ